jgi:hypothetical protein
MLRLMTRAVVMYRMWNPHRGEACAGVRRGCGSEMSARNVCSADRTASDTNTPRRASTHMAKAQAATTGMRATTAEVYATAPWMHPAEAAAKVQSAASHMHSAAASEMSAATTTASERLGGDRNASQ